jgi:DHA2 family multidrug resistance protein
LTRKLIGFGFFLLTSALIEMHTLNLGVSYGYLAFLRIFQASGLAFLFIPINTIAYIGVKQSENNDVSGLTNLARNVGGSCGTAFMATMLLRRTATHETNMVRNLTPANPAFTANVNALKGSFGHGFQAVHAAEAFIYNQLHRQAAMLAYLDIIQYLSIFCACMLPLLFFIPRPPKHASRSAGH